MGLVINNKKIEIPGLVSRNYLDGIAHIKHITDFNPRRQTLQMICVHTHIGKLGELLPGFGPNTTIDDALARYQTNTKLNVSWDYSNDQNGDITAQSDPTKTCSWHAGQPSINNRSLGIEMIQTREGHLYAGQIEKTVLLIDALTALLGIQRVIVWDRSKDAPKTGVVQRLLVGGGIDFVGILGHRNCSKNRGRGDPGDFIFLALKSAGYEAFDLDKEEDLKAWKERQKNLGIQLSECDGIPGPKTLAALKSAGYKHGMYIPRPIDDLL